MGINGTGINSSQLYAAAIASEQSRAGLPATTVRRVVEEYAPVFHGAEYVRIAPGKYSAQCVYAKIYRDPGFRTWKALLRFKLLDTGEVVCGFFNLGKGPKPEAGRRSRYWRAWTLANEGPPSNRQVTSPRIFKGKVFLVEVADVTRTGDGKSHHRNAIYSTVKEIIEKQAG